MNDQMKPAQFVSVAGGIQKRMVTSIKQRKSSRLSLIDSIRNISNCESPKAPVVSDAQKKAIHKKQQIDKWKEEKSKKKKESTANKKKPFVAAMSRRQTFGIPPPVPSTSGRVTRSQTQNKAELSKTQAKSFAPSNAPFKPSITLSEVPTIAPVNNEKVGKTKAYIIFEPVLKKMQKETSTNQTTRAKPTAKSVVDTKKKPNDTTKFKEIANKKPPLLKQQNIHSGSSCSDSEQRSKLRTRPNPQKLIKKKPTKQTSESQDSAYVSQETVSMTSQDSDSTSKDASMLQDIASSQDELHTPRVKVPKSEPSLEEKLRSPKKVQILLTPEQIVEEAKNISPNVTLTGGKDNARKEMKKKLDHDSSNIATVNHLRHRLDLEIARITAMCETWGQIFVETKLPGPIQERVLTTVRQARMLMSQKSRQLAELVESSLITPDDLQGFWDMVVMQVENIDMIFKSLEKLRLRNWIDEQKPEVEKVVPKPAVKKKVVAKPNGGSSRLREVIAAARKAKPLSDNSGSEKSEALPETKTFEGGFFQICTPLKASTPATPINKSTLLKSVLSSDAKTVSMQAPIIAPVNLYATQARSILEQTNPVSTKKWEKLTTVLFNDEEPSSPTSSTSCENPGVGPLPDEEKENKITDQATPNKKSTKTRNSRLHRQHAVEALSSHSQPDRNTRPVRASHSTEFDLIQFSPSQ